MNSNKLYLGVDGGATKTDAVLTDDEGNEISRGLSAGSNAAVFSLHESVDRVCGAVEQALSGHSPKNTFACLAIAGIDTPKDKRIWEQAIKTHPLYPRLFGQKPKIINDSHAALRGGTTAKNAIVIVAGTGSNCFGKNENGKEAKSGGVNFILSDEGSAYDIGLKILRTTTQDLDGRGPKTLLTKLVFTKYHVNNLNDLSSLIYEKPWNKADIGKVALLIDEALDKKDNVAQLIVKDAAHDLATMIKAVITKLAIKNKNFEIVTAGSVFNIKKVLPTELKSEVLKFAPKAKFVEPKVDSATAAAYIAKESK